MLSFLFSKEGVKKMSEEILRVAEILQHNAKLEAEASENYTKQLMVVEAAIAVTTDKNILELLNRIYAATKEKISDELNHNVGLLSEYVELTSIGVAET